MSDLITALGGPSELARITGCKPPSVTEWRLRGIPPERCPAIERAKEGRWICEQLRSDIVWRRLPDPTWPWHPAGRPVRDDTGLPFGNGDAQASPPPDGRAEPPATEQLVSDGSAGQACEVAGSEASHAA